jgi:phosphoglycolate phosphatase-like HAD superfamily hydrolase
MFIRGVIYDYDGVLLDSFRGGLRKIAALCAMEEIPFGREERQRLTSLWGKPAIELLQESLGINESLARKFNEHWIRWDNKQPPELVPGARSTLSWCRRNDFKGALLTSRHRENVNTMLDRVDLLPEFAVVTTREDVTHLKPDPRALRPTLEVFEEKFGIRKEEVVFIGDTPSDIETGHRAGITTLVVQTGPYLLHHSTKRFGGKRVQLQNILPSVDEFPQWVEKNHDGELKHLYF